MNVGTRRALGTAPGVLWLVLRRSMTMLLVGFTVGIPLALAAGRAIAAQLHGVTTHDPATLAGSVLLFALTGLLAIVVPASRAARVDPLTARRTEQHAPAQLNGEPHVAGRGRCTACYHHQPTLARIAFPGEDPLGRQIG